MSMLSLNTEIKFAGQHKHYDNRSFFSTLVDGRQIVGFFESNLQPYVAKFAAQFFQNYLRSNLPPKCDPSKITKTLEQAFEKCQINLIAHPDAIEKFRKSGCSAIVIVRCQQSLWVASLGHSKCFLINQSDPSLSQCVSATHDLTNPAEKKRVLQCDGWYADGLLFNKIPVSRALGNLWQIGAFNWETHTNMKYLDLKALRATNSDIKTVSEVMRSKTPRFCVSYAPHIHHEEDLTNFDQIFVCSNSLSNYPDADRPPINQRHQIASAVRSILKNLELKLKLEISTLFSLDLSDSLIRKLPNYSGFPEGHFVPKKCGNISAILFDLES